MVQLTSPLGVEPAAGQQGALFHKIQVLQAELESVGTVRCKLHVITNLWIMKYSQPLLKCRFGYNAVEHGS